MKKVKLLLASLAALIVATTASAVTPEQLAERSELAGAVVQSSVSVPETSIPDSLLKRAVCIATFPNVIRAGFVFGARYGKGLVSCRHESGWSQPSYIVVRGGSWGLQAGVESIDLVLVFLQPNAIEVLSKSNFTLGVGASIAAGPVGRNAQAGTDYKLKSEILSYSRSRGLFAGLTLEGSTLRADRSANEVAYGAKSPEQILSSDGTRVQSINPYVRALEMHAK